MEPGSAELGSVHAMEIPFVFNSLDRSPINLLYGPGNMDEAEALSKIVQGYWINFAKNGNPNGPGLPEWPEYTVAEPHRQILDTSVKTIRADNIDKCEFWDEYSNKHDPPVMNLGKY